MNKILIYVLLALALQRVSAQNFISGYTANDRLVCKVNGFVEDTINNKLYMYCLINYTNSGCGIGNNNQVACYQNGSWTYSGAFDDYIYNAVIFNNELYVSGLFNNVSGQAIHNLAKYNGTSWVAVPGFSNAINPYRLKVINNQLYVCGGTFTTSNGVFNGLVKYDGLTWSGFNIPDLGDPGFYITDFTFYHGELFIGGNFYLATGDQDLIYFHNGQWQKAGLGLSGTFTGVNKMEVYKDKLYIGGLIYKGDGNPGNMLLEWDGNALGPVGDGLKDNINTYNTATVNDMMVFKGKLYIGGKFRYAGNIFSYGLTTFDGTQYCSFHKTVTPSTALLGISALGHYKDTLWIATADIYMQDTLNMGVGKYIGNYNPDTCSFSYDVGILENELLKSQVNIYPNPITENLTVKLNSNFQMPLFEIFNILGERIYSYRSEVTTQDIDMTFTSRGIYFIRITVPGLSGSVIEKIIRN